MRFDHFHLDAFVIVFYILMHLHYAYNDAFVGEILVRKETIATDEVCVRRRYALILTKNAIGYLL